jgi:hypothetical protein
MADSSQRARETTESEYLAQQSRAAQAALQQAWSEFKANLGHGVDPKAWAKQHPWIALGGAAVAGFAATAALVPSKEQQALRKLAELERALHPPPPPQATNGDAKKEKAGILTTILLEAFALLRPVLASILTAQMGGGPAPAAPQMTQPDGDASPDDPMAGPAA